MSRLSGEPSSAMRLAALVRKEGLQILRDPSSLAIAFLMPLVLLWLFGHGVSLDARNVPLALVVEQPGAETQRFISGFAQSDFFELQHFLSIQDAERALLERRVHGIVWLRSDFADHLLVPSEAPIGVIVDGVDANKARIIQGYVEAASPSSNTYRGFPCQFSTAYFRKFRIAVGSGTPELNAV